MSQQYLNKKRLWSRPTLVVIIAIMAVAATLMPTSAAGAQAPSVMPVLQARKMASMSSSASYRMAPVVVATRTDRVLFRNHAATVTCGYVTCTVFFTKDASRFLDKLIGGAYSGTKMATAAAIAGIACTFVTTPVGGAVCAGVTGVYAQWAQDAFADAAARDRCATFRYTMTPGFIPFSPVMVIPLTFGTSNGRWCR